MKNKTRKIKGIMIIPFLLIIIFIFLAISNGNIITTNDRMNILIFGVDASDLSNTKGTRADSIMLLSLDSSFNHPVLISIPRDTRVPITGRSFPEKVNHAHAYGGVGLLVSTIEDFLDISIDYYAKINYSAVEKLVDAIGGITIEVPIDMQYKDPYADPPLDINIEKGLQTLNGKESLHFLRFRSGYINQDLGRIESQQQFANVLMQEILSPFIVFKAPRLFEIFYENVDTNLSKTKITYLGMRSLLNKSNDLSKITLPGKPSMINGVSYYVVNNDDIQGLKEKYLINKTEAVYNSTIEVLNGCGVTGIATSYAEKLKEDQIPIAIISNYDANNVIESFIEYDVGHKKAARKISKLLGIKKLIKITKEEDQVDIRVVIGKDLVPL